MLQDGPTPLYCASVKGHAEVVVALLAKGADMETKEDVSIARAGLCPCLSPTHVENTC